MLRPTHVIVDLGALTGNLSVLETLVDPARVMPVVKANAYGHGLTHVVAALSDVAMLGVAFVEEAHAIREVGYSGDVLVMGTSLPEQMSQYRGLDAIATVSSPAQVTALGSGRVHIKVDSGMGRAGVRPDNLDKVAAALRNKPGVIVEGIYTHFASADETDLALTMDQLAVFQSAVESLRGHGIEAPMLHAANSAGLIQVPESRFDLVRAGISLYGVAPSPAVPLPVGIRPALEWRSTVTSIKHLEVGDSVGYGATWTAHQATKVAGVPVGYGDGFLRSLSGRGSVVINGHRCPILGRVSMDQISVDVTGADVGPGDAAVLIGADAPAGQMADDAGTIAYEVLAGITDRVPRVHLS